MSMPRWLAPFNRRVANRFIDPLVRHMPGFGVVVHTGRKTHREYRTPVAVFRRTGVYILALAFGRDADWVRNVLANDGCVLVTRGQVHRLSRPRIFHDEQRRFLPAPVRVIFGVPHISDFLELSPEGTS